MTKILDSMLTLGCCKFPWYKFHSFDERVNPVLYTSTIFDKLVSTVCKQQTSSSSYTILAVTDPPVAWIFFKYNWSFMLRSSPSKTVLSCFFSGSFNKDSISPFFFCYLLPLKMPPWSILPCCHLLNALTFWRNDKPLQQRH